jgi:hypothetical protein
MKKGVYIYKKHLYMNGQGQPPLPFKDFNND